MALQMSYTANNGEKFEESYWVVSDIDIFKKLHTSEDMMRKSLDLKEGESPEIKAPARDTTPGYYLHLTVLGFKSAADREAGGGPICICHRYPTKHPTWFQYMDRKDMNELDDIVWDMSSNANMLTTAYAHLKTLDFWSSATDVN